MGRRTLRSFWTVFTAAGILCAVVVAHAPDALAQSCVVPVDPAASLPLGAGWHSATGAPAEGAACVEFDPPEHREFWATSYSVVPLAREEIDAAISASSPTFLSLGVYVRADRSTEVIQNPRLTEAAQRAAEQGEADFAGLCGDHFLAGVTHGGEDTAVLLIPVESEDARVRLEAELAAAGRIGTWNDAAPFRSALEGVAAAHSPAAWAVASDGTYRPTEAGRMILRATRFSETMGADEIHPTLATYRSYSTLGIGRTAPTAAGTAYDPNLTARVVFTSQGRGARTSSRGSQSRSRSGASAAAQRSRPDAGARAGAVRESRSGVVEGERTHDPSSRTPRDRPENPDRGQGRDDRAERRDDRAERRENNREDRQDFRRRAREDWQEWADDARDDRWRHHHHHWTYVSVNRYWVYPYYYYPYYYAYYACPPVGTTVIIGTAGMAVYHCPVTPVVYTTVVITPSTGYRESEKPMEAQPASVQVTSSPVVMYQVTSDVAVYSTSYEPKQLYWEKQGDRHYWVPGAARATPEVQDAIRRAMQLTKPTANATVITYRIGDSLVYLTNEPPVFGTYAKQADVLYAWIPGVGNPTAAHRDAIDTALTAHVSNGSEALNAEVKKLSEGREEPNIQNPFAMEPISTAAPAQTTPASSTPARSTSGMPIAIEPGQPREPASVQRRMRLVQRLQENQMALGQYSWKQRTEIQRKGETKNVKLEHVRFDEKGEIQRILLSAPPQPATGRRGRQQEEMREYIQRVMQRLGRYMQPSPAGVQQMIQKAQVWEGKGPMAGTIHAEVRGYLMADDHLDLWLESSSRQPRRLEVRTLLDDKPVRAVSEYRTLPGGIFYVESTVVELPQDEIQITLETFDYLRRAETED